MAAATSTRTKTLTPRVTLTKSNTPVRSATPTMTYTRTATSTPTITRTFTPSVTRTPSRTFTPTRTGSHTPTNTNTPTDTPTPTFTPTDTATPTDTPTATATLLPAVPDNQVWTYYYYAGSERLAQKIWTSTSSQVYFIFSDHLGSTSRVADGSGNVIGERMYKPWGEERFTSGTTPTDYGFTGQREEQANGFIWFGTRWYDSTTGRFTQPDSIVPDQGNPLGFDRFAYVANNPISRTDESGHCWGIASGIRGLPSYDTTCNNLEMALTIVQSDQATAGQKAGAVAYIGAEGLAHTALVVGSVACLSNVAGCVAGAKAALGIGGAAGQVACADGDCGNEVKLVEAAVQKGIQAIQNGSGTGYQSFEAFKRAQGGAGNGWAWHHIIPKLPGNVAKFGEQMINNTNNLIRLPEGPGSLHRQLTAIYNSINPAITGSRTMLVRDWVATLSYQEQWTFGIELIQKLGGAQYIIDKFQ